jgi:hypothetical protein
MIDKPLFEKRISEILGGDVVRIKLLRDWAVTIVSQINYIMPKLEKISGTYVKLWGDGSTYSIRELAGIEKFLLDRFEVKNSDLGKAEKH